jgi:hypothetical protein
MKLPPIWAECVSFLNLRGRIGYRRLPQRPWRPAPALPLDEPSRRCPTEGIEQEPKQRKKRVRHPRWRDRWRAPQAPMTAWLNPLSEWPTAPLGNVENRLRASPVKPWTVRRLRTTIVPIRRCRRATFIFQGLHHGRPHRPLSYCRRQQYIRSSARQSGCCA